MGHTPKTANGGIDVAANIEAIGVRVSVTAAIVRGVVVTPKTDNRSRKRVIGTAVRVIGIAVRIAAIVRRSRGTAAPGAPTTVMPIAPAGFGRSCH
jgi:hypothetical protein